MSGHLIPGFVLALIFSDFQGCAPIRAGASASAVPGPAPTAANTLRSFNYSTPATNIGAAALTVPLILEWQASQGLDANYEVSFCDQTGANCTLEFTILCAGRRICEVQLPSGTFISNYFVNRVPPPESGSPMPNPSAIPFPSPIPSPIPIPSPFSSPAPVPSPIPSPAPQLMTPLVPGFQGFHVELCNVSAYIIPTNAAVQIGVRKADGSAGDKILATPMILSSQGRCSI